jgi:hypothetical protein
LSTIVREQKAKTKVETSLFEKQYEPLILSPNTFKSFPGRREASLPSAHESMAAFKANQGFQVS